MRKSKKPQPTCGAIDFIQKDKKKDEKKDEKSQSPPLIHDPKLDEKEVQVSVSPSVHENNQMTVHQVAAESANWAPVQLHPPVQQVCSGEKQEKGPVEGTSKLELVRGVQHSRALQTKMHANKDSLSVFDDSSLSDVSDDEGTLTASGQQKTKNPDMDLEDYFDELSLSSDTSKDDTDSSFLDSTIAKQQNIFHKYERSIQKEKSHHDYLADKVRQMKLERSQLKILLKKARYDESALERNQLELKSEVTNLNSQLKQEQEKLRRMEELHQQRVQEKQKLESTLRNLELEMGTLTRNMKQLKDDHSEAQRLLCQESSARIQLENLLKSNTQKQEEMEEENIRNKSRSNEALSQFNEAGVRERELLQQIAALQEQVSTIKSDLQRSNANSSLKESHLLEENEILKEQLKDARRDLKLSNREVTQTVFSCNDQLAALKAELAVSTTQLENERRAREALEIEVRSTQSRLAGALKEAEFYQTRHADAEKALLREKEEHQRLKDRLTSETATSREAVSSLSQKLAKAESDAKMMEDEVSRVTLQLKDKSLLLDVLQREKNQASTRVKDLDSVRRVKARQEATQKQLVQVQSEAMLLRQQLEEAQNKGVAKETQLWQLQQELADSLKKLSMSEASLEVNTCYRKDLERQKAGLLEILDRLKGKLEESEDQYVRAEKRIHSLKGSLDESENELASATRKLQEALSASATSAITIKQLDDAVQRLERENARQEAAAKLQSSNIDALQKDVEEAARRRGHLEDLVADLQSSKKALEDQLSREVQKQSFLSHTAQDSRALLEEELKRRSKLELRMAELEEEKGELTNQMEIQKRKSKKLTEQKETVDTLLDQEMKKNKELEKETDSLRISLKTAKKKLQLERSKRHLEEEVLDLRQQMKVEQTQLEKYRRETEERVQQEIQQKLDQVNLVLQTQAASQQALDLSKAANEAKLRSQLEQKIQELEAELSQARTTQQDSLSQRESIRLELERYQQLYREELRLRLSLATKLEKNSGVEDYLAEMQNEWHRNTRKELRNVKLDDASACLFPVGSTSRVELDPFNRARQDYLEVLKKNYRI